jgi:hypothetical protein
MTRACADDVKVKQAAAATNNKMIFMERCYT